MLAHPTVEPQPAPGGHSGRDVRGPLLVEVPGMAAAGPRGVPRQQQVVRRRAMHSETKPGTSNSAGPPRDELAAAAGRIRLTSRATVTGFAAVAAVVVGTAPLDKIGDLERGSWQFWLAALGLALVLVGVVCVIRSAAAVDEPVGASPEQLKLAEAELSEDQKKKRVKVPASLKPDHPEVKAAARWIRDADLVDVRDVKKTADTSNEATARSEPITFLANARDLARDAWLTAELDVEAQPDPAKRSALEKKNAGRLARFKRLDDELTYVVTLANYHRLTSRFDERKPRIVGAAIIAAVGIVLFKYAANAEKNIPTPPKLEGVALTRAVGVNFKGASLAGARLVGADLRRTKFTGADLTAADMSGSNLEGADLSGANLNAANLRGAKGLTPATVKDATWIGATCPDGTPMTSVDESCASEARLDGSGT